jgi:hypothetical protein
MSNPGRPRTIAKRVRGIVVFGPSGMMVLIMRYRVKEIAAGENECTGQLCTNNKLHREAECPAEITNEDELSEVVYCRIDPATTLRKKDPKSVWHDGLADRRGQK